MCRLAGCSCSLQFAVSTHTLDLCVGWGRGGKWAVGCKQGGLEVGRWPSLLAWGDTAESAK